MKPRFKAGDHVILVGNQKLWGEPGIDVSSSLYRTIPPGTHGTVDENNATTPFVRFDGFEGRYCLHEKWLVPESPSAEDIFVTLPGCDAAPTEDDTSNMGLPPDTRVTFIDKCRATYAGQWWVRRADNNMPRIIGPKWLRLVETEETKENLDMNKIRLITRKWLERHGACRKELDFFDTVIFGDALPECDINILRKDFPGRDDWIDWLNSLLDRYGHELKTIKIGDTIRARRSELDLTAGHEYEVAKGPAIGGHDGLCVIDEAGDKLLIRFHHFSIPEKTKEAAPTVELWAVSPGVEIPSSILKPMGFGADTRPNLLSVCVCDGIRTLENRYRFGAGTATRHLPQNDFVIVDIWDQDALKPYLPQVTKLTRAEVAERLGIENLEIVD